MKKDHEGKMLKDYLKHKKRNQAAVSKELGYKTRQGLTYHFDKPVLDFEFKQLLRSKGILLFDENGKANAEELQGVNEPGVSYIGEKGYKALYELSEKHVLLLKEQVQLYREILGDLDAGITVTP